MEADWHLAAALASAGSRSRLSSSGPRPGPARPPRRKGTRAHRTPWPRKDRLQAPPPEGGAPPPKLGSSRSRPIHSEVSSAMLPNPSKISCEECQNSVVTVIPLRGKPFAPPAPRSGSASPPPTGQSSERPWERGAARGRVGLGTASMDRTLNRDGHPAAAGPSFPPFLMGQKFGSHFQIRIFGTRLARTPRRSRPQNDLDRLADRGSRQWIAHIDVPESVRQISSEPACVVRLERAGVSADHERDADGTGRGARYGRRSGRRESPLGRRSQRVGEAQSQ